MNLEPYLTSQIFRKEPGQIFGVQQVYMHISKTGLNVTEEDNSKTQG